MDGTITLERLTELPTLSMDEEGDKVTWELVGPDGETRSLSHRPQLLCASSDVLRKSALEGLGVALLPEHVGRNEIGTGAPHASVARLAFSFWNSSCRVLIPKRTRARRPGLYRSPRSRGVHSVGPFLTGPVCQPISPDGGVRNDRDGRSGQTDAYIAPI